MDGYGGTQADVEGALSSLLGGLLEAGDQGSGSGQNGGKWDMVDDSSTDSEFYLGPSVFLGWRDALDDACAETAKELSKRFFEQHPECHVRDSDVDDAFWGIHKFKDQYDWELFLRTRTTCKEEDIPYVKGYHFDRTGEIAVGPDADDEVLIHERRSWEWINR